MKVSRAMVGGAVAVAAVVAIATWGLIALLDDPDQDVSAADVGTVSVVDGVAGAGGEATAADTAGASRESGASGGSGGSGSSRSVVELEALSGTGVQSGDDADDVADVTVEGVELDFGPDEWVVSVGPLEDFDGDGDTEALRREIEGLVDQPVELLVAYDDGERDEADVYEINGMAFRDPSGAAPWESDASDAVATRDDVARAAAAEIGAGATVVDTDRDDENGTVTWEVEVLDADGREHTVLLNGAGDVQGSSLDD